MFALLKEIITRKKSRFPSYQVRSCLCGCQPSSPRRTLDLTWDFPAIFLFLKKQHNNERTDNDRWHNFSTPWPPSEPSPHSDVIKMCVHVLEQVQRRTLVPFFLTGWITLRCSALISNFGDLSRSGKGKKQVIDICWRLFTCGTAGLRTIILQPNVDAEVFRVTPRIHRGIWGDLHRAASFHIICTHRTSTSSSFHSKLLCKMWVMRLLVFTSLLNGCLAFQWSSVLLRM